MKSFTTWTEIFVLQRFPRIIPVILLCFLDLTCRYSYQYLGWLSYLLRLIGYCSVPFVVAIPQDNLVTFFKYMMAAPLVICAWIVSKILVMVGETQHDISTPTYIILKVSQFVLIFSYFNIFNVNNVTKFGIYLYIFYISGVVLLIPPDWVSNFLLISTIFLIPKIVFYAYKNRKDISNSFDTYGHQILDYVENCKYTYKTTNLTIYFIILATFSALFNVFHNEAETSYLDAMTSTLGMCCATFISSLCLSAAFVFVLKLSLKYSCFSVKGPGYAVPEQYRLDSSEMFFAFLICIFRMEMFIFDMEPLDRGVMSYNFLMELAVLFVTLCFSAVSATSLEESMKPGYNFTFVKIIAIHIVYGLVSLLMVHFLFGDFSNMNFSKVLAIDSFICLFLSVVVSLLLNVLYKLDSSQSHLSTWECLDDVVFFTRITLSIVGTSIHMITVYFTACTIYNGLYLWFDLWRFLCFIILHVCCEIIGLRIIFAKRKEITVFVSDLENVGNLVADDACAICLNKMIIAKKTPCGHLFHTSCLKKVLDSQFSCPLCRRQFSQTPNTVDPLL